MVSDDGAVWNEKFGGSNQRIISFTKFFTLRDEEIYLLKS